MTEAERPGEDEWEPDDEPPSKSKKAKAKASGSAVSAAKAKTKRAKPAAKAAEFKSYAPPNPVEQMETIKSSKTRQDSLNRRNHQINEA